MRKSGQKHEFSVQGRTLKVSNLDSVLFPVSGFPKASLLDYYIKVSPYLLPHLVDRPLTLKMFHDGVHGEAVYERNAPGFTPDWVHTFPVPRKAGGSPVCYLLVNDLPSLVWVANLSNIEMHVFLARIPKVHQPTFVLFDLDPGEPATVLDCAQVSLLLKTAIENLDLQCLIKSSGSKGLHLYVPLNTPVDYTATHTFAKFIAESLAKRFPELVVARMDKRLRHGKVFVDYGQNADYKSTVAVYSLRAKSEIPLVSFPIAWKQVKDAVAKGDPSCFIVGPQAALTKLQDSGDLFEPLLRLKQKLPRPAK